MSSYIKLKLKDVVEATLEATAYHNKRRTYGGPIKRINCLGKTEPIPISNSDYFHEYMVMHSPWCDLFGICTIGMYTAPDTEVILKLADWANVLSFKLAQQSDNSK